MRIPTLSAHYSTFKKGLPRCRLLKRQRGVVLVIALILLVVISLLTITSMRNASSSENVSSNVRTTELAIQAAEIALRHCESSVLRILKRANGDEATPEANYPTTFDSEKILPAANPAQWQNVATWDSPSTATYVLTPELLNQTGMTTTYKRTPECMVEQLPVLLTNLPVLDGAGKIIANNGTRVSTTTTFMVTARGFGPEVAVADLARSRPVGTEAWLQSHVDLTYK